MGCNDSTGCQGVDIGQNIYDYLTGWQGIQQLLHFENDHNELDVAVHRGHAPQQDQMEDAWGRLKGLGHGECLEVQWIRPYLWYEMSEEANDEPCIDGGCHLPVDVSFEFEVVSFDLDMTLAVASELRRAILALEPEFEAEGPKLKDMAGIEVQAVLITAASDDYQPVNGLAGDLGGFVRSYSVDISPSWRS